MVLVKKKKIETKPVDDELEKKKKMLAYTQGKLAPKCFLSVEFKKFGNFIRSKLERLTEHIF